MVDAIRDFEQKFIHLGAVKNAKRRPIAEVKAIFDRLHAAFDTPGATKSASGSMARSTIGCS